MNKKDIYVGKIKKCNNLLGYKMYGESRYVEQCSINHIEFGETYLYVDTIDNQAILLKMKNGDFTYLTSLSYLKRILIDLNIYSKTLKTFPSDSERLYVDETSLIPYYENPGNKKVTTKKLSKELLLDARIMGGIEH